MSPRPPASRSIGHQHPARHRRGLLAVAAAAVLVSGCEIELGGNDLAPDEDAFEDVETPQAAEGRTVPLEVGEATVGGGTLVFVPVHIDDTGPFTFVLDTGASNTAVDRELAEELELDTTGPEGPVEGITGEGAGTVVRIETWRLGEIELAARDAVALDLGGEGGGEFDAFDGLLGSDVLSEFGSVTIDYDTGVLVLPD